jgi:cytochrome c oxidase subunit IV
MTPNKLEAHADAAHGDGHGDGHGHGHGGADHVPHVLPIKTYITVWLTLVAFTVITVWVSRIDFGAANFFIAIFVATIKATLVGLFFMHLLYDQKFNILILMAALVFFAIFIGFTKFDVDNRGAGDPNRGIRVPNVDDPFAPAKPPAKAEPKAAEGHEAPAHH